MMPTHKSLIAQSVAALVVMTSLTAHAVTTPVFTSGPAIASRGSVGFPNSTTFVFGYQSGVLTIFSPASTATWTNWPGGGLHFLVPGGWDGDPAAVYFAKSNSSAYDIMNCGHSAGAGLMYCTPAVPPVNAGDHYLPDPPSSGAPIPVGSRQFAAGSTPALVNWRSYLGNNVIWMFARSTDNQIYYTTYTISAGTWRDWTMVTPPPGDSFSSDPAATTYTASDDLIIVCARLASNSQIACSQQTYGPGGSLLWASWTPVPGQLPTVIKPGLTKSYSSVLIFEVRTDTNFSEIFASFPVGGGNWTSFSAVNNKIGLRNGPAAVANTANSSAYAMTASRGPDSAFWYSPGRPDMFNNLTWDPWVQLQQK